FLGYEFDDGPRTIEVNWLVAGSARTAAALWGILGSHSTVTRTVRAYVGPNDPIGWLIRWRDAAISVRDRWMLRVIDPVAAIAGRGFPAAVHASVDLRLADAARPGNSGDYRLTVADGTGKLVKTDGPDGTGEPLALGARGL